MFKEISIDNLGFLPMLICRVILLALHIVAIYAPGTVTVPVLSFVAVGSLWVTSKDFIRLS